MISRGLMLMDIVQLVALRLKVTPIDRWRRQLIKKPHRQKIIDHRLLASLKSGELVDLSDIQLAILSHLPFLTALANILEAAITHGLDIAHRLGWNGQQWSWQLGESMRAYYETTSSRKAQVRHHDPVTRLAGMAQAASTAFTRRMNRQ